MEEDAPKGIVVLSKRKVPLDTFAMDHDTYHLQFLSDEARAVAQKVKEFGRIQDGVNRRFWNLIVSTVERSGYNPPQGKKTQILDIGCGECHEGYLISAFFGGNNYGSPSELVHITAIDMDGKSIDKAKSVYSSRLGTTMRFIQGDATQLEAIESVPDVADVVIMRHQQYHVNPTTWSEIAKQALQRVSENGILIVTSYNQSEHADMLQELREIGGQVTINERNNEALPIPNSSDSAYDQYIAIVKRSFDH